MNPEPTRSDHFLLVGGGGREASFAVSLARDSVVSAFVTHKNPTIVECVARSGGALRIGDVRDPNAITRFAVENNIEFAFVSADEPLAAGVVDSLLRAGIKTIGATKAAARIEWDKIYSISLMQAVAPEFTPLFTVVETPEQIPDMLRIFSDRGLPVAVKPEGLTGGKGVKIMPDHLPDYESCAAYARELFSSRPTEQVLFVEKLDGIEFTVMGLTDGINLVMSPASYDYPFRFENDTGPGTGGMGCFTATTKNLPFLTYTDIEDCAEIMCKIIHHLRLANTPFNGIINGGFFKTSKGIQFMEFNSRFGDPEGLNILTILETPFSEVLKKLYYVKLRNHSVSFTRKASVIKYLVAPEYPDPSPEPTTFMLDQVLLDQMGLNVFFGACEHVEDNLYRTLGSSRVLAIGATADDIPTASDLVNRGIDRCLSGHLEYRADIGAQKDIDRLMSRLKTQIQTTDTPPQTGK